MINNRGMRKRIENLLYPLASVLPFSANAITISSIIFAFLGFLFFYQEHFLIGLALYALAFAIDAIDGAIARIKGEASSLGAFLDGISDRIVEFFALLPFLFTPYCLQAVIILFFGSAMTSFVKAYAHHRNLLTEKEASSLPGILERGERVILIMVALFLYAASNPTVFYLLWITAALAVITVLQRIVLALKIHKMKKEM